jgi:cysteine desulfurase
VYGIVGFAKALDKATLLFEEDSKYIGELKGYMAEKLQKEIAGIAFNGDAFGKSLYTVLNVSFPKTNKSEMLLYSLDMRNICVSGGSACTSGSSVGSHVIEAVNNNTERVSVRFSFSKHNTREEVDTVVKMLKELI